jgi:hypothetical protein
MKRAKIIDGVEYLDSTPIVQRTRLRLPGSQITRMRNLIRHELSERALNGGQETFAEADDFELPDGEDWVSPYEEKFEPVVDPREGLSLVPSPASSAEGKTAPPSGAGAGETPPNPQYGEPEASHGSS